MSGKIDTCDQVSVLDLVNDKSQWKNIVNSYTFFLDRTNSQLNSNNLIANDSTAMRYFCGDIDNKMNEFVMLFNDITTCKEVRDKYPDIIKDICEYIKGMDEITKRVKDFIDYYHFSGRVYNPDRV
jgi:hypothetical protein